jgi:hypothetical protein
VGIDAAGSPFCVAGARTNLMEMAAGLGRRSGCALHDRTRRPRVAEAMTHSRRLLDRCGHGRTVLLARVDPDRAVLDPVADAFGVPIDQFPVW